MEQNAAKIVNSAILGLDAETVIVAGKMYIIMPPTMRRLAGAAYWLSGIEGESIKDAILSSSNIKALCHSLSWMIQGNDSLVDELLDGTDTEIKEALDKAYSLLSAENFTGLLALAKNVAKLTAKQR